MSVDPVLDSNEGPLLRVRTHPGARREGVVRVDDAGVRVSVRAPADKGKANEAVLRVLAVWLGVPRASLTLRAGKTSPDKRVLVRGMDADALRAVVQARTPD